MNEAIITAQDELREKKENHKSWFEKKKEELKTAIELRNKEQTRRRFRSYSKGRTVGQL